MTIISIIFKVWHKIVIKFYLDQYIKLLTNRSDESYFARKIISLLKSDLKEFNLSSVKSQNKYSLVDIKRVKKYIVASLESKNQTVTPTVIDFSYESKIDFKNVSLKIYKFPKATVTYGSDIIRLSEIECYWYKHYQHFMYKTIPMDKDLYLYDKKDKGVLLAKEKYSHNELDNVVSLIGAKDFSWAHFVVEYLPKLEVLKKHYYEEKFTVLIPKLLDNNCKEMVDFMKSPYWNIHELEKGCSISCKNLYYLDCTSWLTDHSETLILGDTMLYGVALDALKAFVNDYQKRNAQPKHRLRRIYLRRDNSVRSLINVSEIDALLETYNFEVVYGHELTLEEKADIFSQAELVVGPGSSGFVNMIFCQEGTKIIGFVNKNRVWDTYFPTIAHAFKLDFKYLLSKNEKDINNPHTSYSIDVPTLEKEIRLSLGMS